jgi:hypothetical protein
MLYFIFNLIEREAILNLFSLPTFKKYRCNLNLGPRLKENNGKGSLLQITKITG